MIFKWWNVVNWSAGAVNPRDSDLKITDAGDHLVFDGFKNFNTGGVVSDLTVLEGVFAETENHIFAFVPTEQPGIQFAVRKTISSQSKEISDYHSTIGTTSDSVSQNLAASKLKMSRSRGLMLLVGTQIFALPTQLFSQFPSLHSFYRPSSSSSPTSISA